MSITSPLSLPELRKSLEVPTRQHLHLLRTDACMQWWPWIQMGKKQYSNVKQDFRLGKCYIACLLYTLLAVLKVFLILLFTFSSPSLGADFITGTEEKKNNWSHEDHSSLLTWFPFLPSPTRSLFGELQWLRELMWWGGWELWLCEGSQVSGVWLVH